MPSGTRLVWMMTVSPSKVCSAPVIDMAVLHSIDSSHFVSKQGPAAVKLQSALHKILGQNQRSEAYVILGTATTLYNLWASFIHMPVTAFVKHLNTIVHLIAFSQTFHVGLSR